MARDSEPPLGCIVVIAFAIFVAVVIYQEGVETERRNALAKNTAVFLNHYAIQKDREKTFLGGWKSVDKATCALQTSVTRIPEKYIAEFETFGIQNEGERVSAFVLVIEPKSYSPDSCFFELADNRIQVIYHGNTIATEEAIVIEGDISGRRPFLVTDFRGSLIAPKRSYRNFEVRFTINIESVRDSDEFRENVNSATFSRTQLASSAALSDEVVIWSPDNDDIDEIVDFALEAGEWVSPGFVGKSLRWIRNLNKATKTK